MSEADKFSLGESSGETLQTPTGSLTNRQRLSIQPSAGKRRRVGEGKATTSVASSEGDDDDVFVDSSSAPSTAGGTGKALSRN